MADPVNFVPPAVAFTTRAGNDMTFTITLPYNTTGGTHELLIAASPGGAAIATLTDGDGLTITPGATSTIAVVIDKTLTAAQSGKELNYDYNLTLSGLKSTKVTGTILIKPSVQPGP